jgi:ubiquinone/menaquinone biosynthesis C-methylase UbiE
MSRYFLAAGGVIFTSMSFHHYRKYRENVLYEIYSNFPEKEKIFKEAHDTIASKWDDEMDKYEWSKRIDKYRKVLCSYAEGTALEVGIGTGFNINFYPLGINLTGIDWSDNMLSESKSKNKFKKNIKFINMDAKDLKYDDDTFDTVVGTFVLSSSDLPEKIMSEMYRVCKKNGKILVLDRGYADDLLTMVLLNLYRYEYIFKYGYDQCSNIKKIVRSVPAEIIVEEIKQGGHIYFYILKKV